MEAQRRERQTDTLMMARVWNRVALIASERARHKVDRDANVTDARRARSEAFPAFSRRLGNAIICSLVFSSRHAL